MMRKFLFCFVMFKLSRKIKVIDHVFMKKTRYFTFIDRASSEVLKALQSQIITYNQNFMFLSKVTFINFNALRNLLPFLQFKKREKHLLRNANFSKFAS